MTTYAADGAYGSITSQLQERDALHAAGDGKTAKNVDSVNVVQGDNDIPLTGLTFSEISWEFRLSTVFADRALLDYALEELQYDSSIDGFIGAYQPSGPYYERTEGIDEGLEVHGGVDGAWWQLILTGLGTALFTNGEWSQEVDLIAGDMYTVSMGLNTETGYASVTLWDRFGTAMATGSRNGLSIPLSVSHFGITGTEFNYAGNSTDYFTTGDYTYLYYSDASSWDGERTFGEYAYHPSGNQSGFLPNVGGPIWPPTGTLGTCSAQSYISWVHRPYWASCPGRLDNTFVTWITNETWFKMQCLAEAPPGYEEGYLEWSPWYAPQQLEYEPVGTSWSGKLLTGWSHISQWPQSWKWGYAGGGHIWTQTGHQYIGPFYTPTAYLREGYMTYFGVQIDEGSWAQQPPAYTCGFTWPWQNSDLGSWKNYTTDPDSWRFRFVLDPEVAAPMKLEVNQIWFGSPTFEEEEEKVIIEENEVAEGWNTEMVLVIDGVASIRATPVQGSVNVYDAEGGILSHPDEWEEADDLALDYLIHTDDGVVTINYFVSRPIFDQNQPIISRPALRELEENISKAVLAHGP
jgi:hypothetical protein